jgi:hypothetical protein
MARAGQWITCAVVGALATGCAPAEPPPAQQADTGEPSWVDLAAHNIGAPINTMWSEGELAFADDGTMVFTSSRQDLAVAPGDPKDLYLATFNEETGQWNTPVNMGIPVNAAPATDVDPLRLGDDREPWITPDGSTIYFKSDRLATSSPRNANDVFVTHKVDGAWSLPEKLPFPISTDAGNEHCPMLLRDGETLCFASMREGGYGGSDIWCSQQEADGSWQDPVNQGPNINTEGQEFHFMEGQHGRVYFTSDRPGGFGGMDIWTSQHVPGATGPDAWSLAENLGPLVNTTSADMCPAFSGDGETMAWFSSRTDNNWGEADIFWTYTKTPEAP